MEGGDKRQRRLAEDKLGRRRKKRLIKRAVAFVALGIQTMCHFLIKPFLTKMLKQKKDFEKQRWQISEAAWRPSRSQGCSSSVLPQPPATDDL